VGHPIVDGERLDSGVSRSAPHCCPLEARRSLELQFTSKMASLSENGPLSQNRTGLL
jgi:hypothetical protein